MKRSYSYLKGLLSLALAAFTGWMWAAETVYPAMPSYTITSAEYGEVISPVLMPTPAVTTFSVTIVYQSGGQRSDISQMILVDPETGTTIAEDIHEGYSGGQKYQHVYTFENIPESYAGQKLLVKMTVKCNESGTSTCNVELSDGVTHTSITPALHEYANDKEFFSISFGDVTSVSGSAGLYAAEGWNNCTGASGTKKALTMWTGSTAKGVKIGMEYSSANTWSWMDASDALLDGYLDDGGNQAQITLTDIPFSQYSVIVYCATDTENNKFNPVTINSIEYIGSDTYTEGTGYAVASSETWGASHALIALFGTNALRVDGLTGNLSIVGGKNANNARGGIAAIQVINTGTLGEITESTETTGDTVMGYYYPLVFRGSTDTQWATIANWHTLDTLTVGEEVTRTWTPISGDKVPGTPGSNLWTATVVNGDLLDDTITVGSDGYKTITAPLLEGWESKMGVANGVHLSIENMNKLQSDSDWRVDETSKITLNAYNNGNNGGTHNIVCLAENGIEFKANCTISFNYTLGAAGSVNYTGALSGTQTIKGLVLDLGDSSKSGVELKTRKLIGFTSSSATFNTASMTISTSEDAVTAVAAVAPANVGEYTFVTEADGYYINYVGYGDATYSTVTATVDADTTLSALGLEGGEMVNAEITCADGVTLTIDEAATFATISLISTGDVTVVSTTENLANLNAINAEQVAGTATYATTSTLQDVPAKLPAFDVIKKTGDDSQTPTSLAILDGRQLIVENGELIIDITFTGVTATAEKPVLVTGTNSKLQLVGTNHQQNRMPNDGYVKATNGGTIVVKGVNLFKGDNAPNFVLDGGILQTAATDGGHIKVNSVSMANGSKLQLSRAATAYQSEGLYIRTGDDSKLIVTAGDNVVEYLEDGTANNALKIDAGVIDIAAGASLDVKTPVTTDVGAITKTGDGALIWNGTTTNPITVSAGSLVFNADAAPTNALSGNGTVVADGAVLNLTGTTVAETLALTVKNNGTLILTLDQVGTMTIPAGGTLKVFAGTYNEVSLTGLTLEDDTAKVVFVLPNNREVEPTIVTEDGVTTVTMPSQKAFVWTPAVDTNWSTVGNWVTGGEAMTAAPTAAELTQYPVIVELAADTTLTMDTAASLVDLTIYTIDETAATHVLTIAGENALTTKHISSDNKVVVTGELVIDAAGTEAAPTEITNVIEVAEGGTLTTKGYVNLTADNQVLAGTLTASTGATTFKGATGSWEGGLQGTINVKADAKLALAGTDIVNWNSGDTAPLTINVKGELDIGTTRLGLNKKTLNLYAGATVKGEGDGQGALDYFTSASEINVLADGENTADVTISAKIRTRENAAPTFNVANKMKAIVSGVIFGGSKVVAGSGLIHLTAENTYTGGTTINAGATIEIANIDNLSSSGDVLVNGRLRIAPAAGTDQSATTAYGTAEAPRLTGTGVLEFAGDGHYAIPAGFTTPLAVENNRAGGIVVTGAPGITIGTLSGTGYFRADWGDNGEGTRVITVKQSAASTFSGYVQAGNETTRAMSILVAKADGVEEGTDTTLTLSGTTSAAGTSMTVAEGATVNVTGTWARPVEVAGTVINTGTVSGAVTGAGTVLLPTRTITNLSLSNLADANTTLKIPEGATVAGYFNSATWSVAAKVQLDGALELNNGYSAANYTFTGPLSGTGSISLSNDVTDVVRFTGDIKDFTGDFTITGKRAITFCAAETATDQRSAGAIVVHGDYATTAMVNGTWTAPVVVEAGATIGGTGKISGRLTINGAGATLDASAGPLTVDNEIWVLTDAKPLAITLPEEADVGTVIVNCTNAADIVGDLTGAPAGYKYVADGTAVKLAVAKVNVTIPAAPANTKWFDADGNEVSGTIAVDPNTDVTLTLKANDGYVFADGSTSTTVTVNSGADGAEVTAPDVTAAEAKAKIGQALYTSFAAALADAEANNVITLLADATITACTTIDKNLTIDLNGNTIAETTDDPYGALYVKKGATLTIDATDGGEITTDGGIVIGNYGTVIVNGGTINAGPVAEDDVSVYNFYYAADYYGTTTVNGGTVTRIWNCGVASLVGGTVTDVDNSGAMTITGTSVTNVILRDGSDAGDVPDAGTLKASGDLTVTTEEGFKAVYDSETGTWTAIDPAEGMVAQIGETYYATLEGAIADAAVDAVIKLLADAETPAFKIEKSLTIDLGGNKLTLAPQGVGSTGTTTLGIQILNTATAVTIKNGTIAVTEGNKTYAGEGKPIKMLINNYTNLTLTDVALDGTNLYKEEGKVNYVLSNNSGTVALNGTTSITAPEGGVAFDVCKYASYAAPEVTVADTVTITGTIEITGGALVAPESLAAQMVTAEGYKVALQDGKYVMVKKGAFVVDGTDYATLAEAYVAGDTITMIADAETPAFKIEKSLTIDLGGNTLTLAPQGVGSTGTTTLGIQILNTATAVTIKNGTIAVTEGNKTYAGEGKPIKMLINNYTNLTLTDVALDGTNLYKEEGKVNYVLSNNSGTVALNGTTSITAPEGGVAFDVCKYASYAAPEVTVADTVTITGTIEITGGALVAPESLAAQMVTAEGYKVALQDGKYVMVKKGAFVVDGTDYATLAEAYVAGDTITLTADAESAGIKIQKNVTIDLGGYTLSLTPPAVGSTGTETLGIQILKNTTVAISNGTINVAESNLTAGNPIKMMIQNYSTALTLTAVTLDGTNLVKPDSMAAYTLSNNSGTVTIDADSTIIAKEGGVAFDVCKYSSYAAPEVTVAEGATITGTIELSGGELVGGASLSVESGVEGYKAVYDDTEGWILEKIITLPEELVDSPAAATIEAAMEAAGVTEITSYTVTTKGTAGVSTVQAVADVLAVFDVAPAVDADGELSIAYEFGIASMTNADEVITITAGVDANTTIREGVKVTFYADDDEIGSETVAAGATTATITGIQAADINGKKITVKAIK